MELKKKQTNKKKFPKLSVISSCTEICIRRGMRKQSTAENEDEAFQMQGEKKKKGMKCEILTQLP